MKENQNYKNEGLAALKGNWAQAVLAMLVCVLIICACEMASIGWLMKNGGGVPAAGDMQAVQSYLGGAFFRMTLTYLLIFLVVGPLLVGLVNALKELVFSGDGKIVSNSFKIGYGNYWRHVWGFLLRGIFIFLWSLLLIVPGIIKSLSYAMTFYILRDRPELSVNQAINLSKDMMYGHKFDLFYLYLSFIGWILLCILTLGIGILWVYPYIEAAQASFYADVKADYEARQGAAS